MITMEASHSEALRRVRAIIRQNFTQADCWRISTAKAEEVLSRERGSNESCEELLAITRAMRFLGALTPEAEDLDFFLVTCPVLRIVANRLSPQRPSLKGATPEMIAAAFREFQENDIASLCLENPQEVFRRFNHGRRQLHARIVGRRSLGSGRASNHLSRTSA